MTWIVAITELKREIFKIKSGKDLNEKEIQDIQGRERSMSDNKGKNWKSKNVDKSVMDVS